MVTDSPQPREPKRRLAGRSTYVTTSPKLVPGFASSSAGAYVCGRRPSRAFPVASNRRLITAIVDQADDTRCRAAHLRGVFAWLHLWDGAPRPTLRRSSQGKPLKVAEQRRTCRDRRPGDRAFAGHASRQHVSVARLTLALRNTARSILVDGRGSSSSIALSSGLCLADQGICKRTLRLPT